MDWEMRSTKINTLHFIRKNPAPSSNVEHRDEQQPLSNGLHIIPEESSDFFQIYEPTNPLNDHGQPAEKKWHQSIIAAFAAMGIAVICWMFVMEWVSPKISELQPVVNPIHLQNQHQVTDETSSFARIPKSAGYVVQFGVFSELHKAEARVNELRSMRIDAVKTMSAPYRVFASFSTEQQDLIKPKHQLMNQGVPFYLKSITYQTNDPTLQEWFVALFQFLNGNLYADHPKKELYHQVLSANLANRMSRQLSGLEQKRYNQIVNAINFYQIKSDRIYLEDAQRNALMWLTEMDWIKWDVSLVHLK